MDKILLVTIVLGLNQCIDGLAHMAEPPARGTEFHNVAVKNKGNVVYEEKHYYNYEKHPQNCGGASWQHIHQGGDCGVCGDAVGVYMGIPLRQEHEAGGIYAKGIITNTYTQGQKIKSVVHLKDNYEGWMEWRICANNDVNSVVQQSCLDKNLLQLADGSGTRFHVPKDEKTVTVELLLAEDMVCTQCVVQWKYNAGNLDGTDPESGEECKGCGPQEETYNCADVMIISHGTGSTSSEMNVTTMQMNAAREIDENIDSGFNGPKPQKPGKPLKRN